MKEQFRKHFTPKPFLAINGDIKRRKIAIPYVDLSYQVHVNDEDQSDEQERSRKSSCDFLNDRLNRSFETDLRGILTASDRLVVITGISGIGKTSMINQLITKWSKDEIWRDQPKIDLIFNIKCSTLNTLHFGGGGKKPEDVFVSLFPNFFKTTSIDIMKTFKNKLLIVDGLDELQDSSDCQGKLNYAHTCSNPLYFVQKIILQTEAFGFHMIIMTSNSRTNAPLRKIVNESIFRIKFVEVLGFSEENSDKYIDNVLGTTSSTQRKLVPFETRLPNDLSKMFRVPAYLSIIIDLTAEKDTRNDLNPTPKSTTELLLYSMLAFYRKHSKTEVENLNMNEIIDSDGFIVSMKHLSLIAFKRAAKNCAELPLTSTSMNDERNSLSHWNGIIKIHKQGEYGIAYKFEHSIMEKLFCSLYLFQKPLGERQYLLYRDCFQQCWPFSVEIERLFEDSASCPILKKLLLKMSVDVVKNADCLRYQLSDQICQKTSITLKDIDNEFEIFSEEYLPHIDEKSLSCLMSKLVVDFLAIEQSKWKKIKRILHQMLSASNKNIHSFYCDFFSMSDEIELCALLLFRAQNIHIPLEHLTNPQVADIIGSCLSVLVGFFKGEENRLLNTLTSKEKIYITNHKWLYSPWRFTPDTCGDFPDGLFRFLPFITDLTLRGLEGIQIDEIIAEAKNAQVLAIEECSLDKYSSIFRRLHFMRIRVMTLTITKLMCSHLLTTDELYKELEHNPRRKEKPILESLALHYCHLDWPTLELLLENIIKLVAIESIDILNYKSLEVTGIDWLEKIARFYQCHIGHIGRILPRILSISDRYDGVELTLKLRYDIHHNKFDAMILFKEYNREAKRFYNTYRKEIMHKYAFCRKFNFGVIRFNDVFFLDFF